MPGRRRGAVGKCVRNEVYAERAKIFSRDKSSSHKTA